VPGGLKCELDYGSWERPSVFDFIAESGVEENEMSRVFNLGIGFVFIVSQDDSDAVIASLVSAGEAPSAVGRIVEA
ncbi:MAG: phosphoribosylformylglycinamidine cyclo-ligase, partial [Synergistaceae bacterium]|jgi:phosphoribosylformylglycinamidine cyclo-ligase|nr:phosphoribosylformylglycinamidine cyclo-ligase [Synergistaceae bacterium]